MFTLRGEFFALGLAAALTTGCDKSGTTPAAGTTTVMHGPGNPGDPGAGKQIVGVWESVEEAKKGAPDEKSTVEFKADGGMAITMGSPPMTFELTGTWKLAKDEGKTVTIDTDLTMKEFPDGKSDKKEFKITFDDPDTMTMTRADKNEPKKFKRKK